MYTLVAHARGRGIFGSFKIKIELAAQGVMAGTNRIRRHTKIVNQIRVDFADQHYIFVLNLYLQF